MDRDDFDPVRAGFAAFRTNWPHYRNSIFKDKVEVVTDGRGKILGVTNPSSLLYAFLPSSSEGIQIRGKGLFFLLFSQDHLLLI